MRVVEVERPGDPGRPSTTVLRIEMWQRYRHVLGYADPFYQGVEQGVLRATRCGGCGRSWFPPRRYCDTDLEETEWYDLPGTGRVVSATRVHSPPPFGGIKAPYILASIRLDGVGGGITHRVLGEAIPERGAVVMARFLEGVPAHPLLRLAFETGQAAG